jgi:hypothetical protein
MSAASRLLGSVRSLLPWSVLLAPALASGAEATLVQQIGELSSEVADAVAAEVEVVPFSPAIDARTTPIILAPGQAFIQQGRPEQVTGLNRAERDAIRQAYDAGQTILVLHPSVHDVEALHVLVKEGVTHQSSTDPTFLAYALRQENDIPTARIVHDLRLSLRAPVPLGSEGDEQAARDRALARALDVITSELTHPPVLAAAPPPAADGNFVDWQQNPVQSNIITVTSNGNFNTPVDIYALHSCLQNKDYYLVNTGGDWTATEAAWTSASTEKNQIHLQPDHTLQIDYEPGVEFCGAGFPVNRISGVTNERICVYMPYPLYYEVDIVPPDLVSVPPDGPAVVQVNAAPAGDQGLSASYSSGFSFSIGGGVGIDGDGPSAGFQAGASWSNEVSTTVPPLVIEAGDTGPGNPQPQGTFTRYRYCTVGTSPGCTSNIQLIDVGAPCRQDVAGQPQTGQTPNGRLSNVAQTVNWRVDPKSYGGNTTFDVTVTWEVNIAASQALFWNRQFVMPGTDQGGGPSGSCNPFGCSCSFPVVAGGVDTHSLTFNVPFPSQKCTSG